MPLLIIKRCNQGINSILSLRPHAGQCNRSSLADMPLFVFEPINEGRDSSSGLKAHRPDLVGCLFSLPPLIAAQSLDQLANLQIRDGNRRDGRRFAWGELPFYDAEQWIVPAWNFRILPGFFGLPVCRAQAATSYLVVISVPFILTERIERPVQAM